MARVLIVIVFSEMCGLSNFNYILLVPLLRLAVYERTVFGCFVAFYVIEFQDNYDARTLLRGEAE
jgi:hypothetical protein